MLCCVSTDAVASSFCRHCAALTDFRHFACCGGVLHWQARSGWLHFAQAGPVLPVFEKSAVQAFTTTSN
jgi:hypothetical protein